MASISDVGETLAGMIGALIYPDGTSQPSVAGVPVIVYPGWPQEAQLDADLLALSATPPTGKCHVTIWPTPMEKNTTRYPENWVQIGSATPTLTATVSGQVVTLGGTISTPQNVVVIANGGAYVYAVQTSDTLSSIATAMSALLQDGGIAATSAGAVLTLPDSAVLTGAKIGTFGNLYREVRRTQKFFQVIVWADTPAHREAIASAIDVGLADVRFLTMPDGFGARLIYQRSAEMDAYQKAKLYRRDLTFSVEFATTQTSTATQVTQVEINSTLQNLVGDAGVTLTTYQ